MADANLTAQQQKWFASVREGLERDTGKTLEQWVKIARTCPETKPGARQKWLKEKHGIGINRAATIFDAAFPVTALAGTIPRRLLLRSGRIPTTSKSTTRLSPPSRNSKARSSAKRRASPAFLITTSSPPRVRRRMASASGSRSI